MRFLDLRRFSGDLLDVRTSVHTMRFFGREMFFWRFVVCDKLSQESTQMRFLDVRRIYGDLLDVINSLKCLCIVYG